DDPCEALVTKRESGANPELPRSGMWERPPSPRRIVPRSSTEPDSSGSDGREHSSRHARALPPSRQPCQRPGGCGRPSLEGGLMTVSSTVHGFPRIGDRRELKTATEGYWAGRVPAGELEATARELRRQTWTFLRDAGMGQVPSNHFSLYDQVLDTCLLGGAVPERHRRAGGAVDLDSYFAMARGRDDATAMEMTKWFDTDYP